MYLLANRIKPKFGLVSIISIAKASHSLSSTILSEPLRALAQAGALVTADCTFGYSDSNSCASLRTAS
jgi:hypothetical protein